MDGLCTAFSKLNLGSKPVVIDVECFRYSKEKWVVKEMAVAGPYLDSATFESPFPFHYLPESHAKAYTWLTDHLHGLMWDCGDLPYSHLSLYVESIKLRHPIALFQFYAKGLEKCKYLSRLFDRPFINLDDLQCPVASKKIASCTSFPCKGIHLNGNHCARNKAASFASFLEQELRWQRIGADNSLTRKPSYLDLPRTGGDCSNREARTSTDT